jgi:hypothetical protein
MALGDLGSLPDKYLQSNFPKWIFWSRIAQFSFSIIILALCAAAISQLKTTILYVFPSFAGLNMFTVSPLSLSQGPIPKKGGVESLTTSLK